MAENLGIYLQVIFPVSNSKSNRRNDIIQSKQNIEKIL